MNRIISDNSNNVECLLDSKVKPFFNKCGSVLVKIFSLFTQILAEFLNA